MRIESRTGRGCNTPRLHQILRWLIAPIEGAKQDRLTVIREVENCGLTTLWSKKIIANDNFALEDYALAA